MKSKIIVLMIICAFIWSYHHSESKTAGTTRIMTVTDKSASTILYYSGIIQPLKSIVVTMPAEGIVDDMKFNYGDTVQAGQLLFTVSSEKFQTDYKAALMDYIKNKNEFDTSNTKLKEGLFLHKNELISDDDFKMRQTDFYNAQLSMLQAKEVLSRLLKQLTIKDNHFFDLNISDIDKITSALHVQAGAQKLQIISPATGIALLPTKTDGSSDKKLGKGDQVKQGDVLALIGDGHGISVRINVNEFDINQLKVGQHVNVTGSAFSDFVLAGTITGVDHQAQLNVNGIPSFSAEVAVPMLTPKELEVIHIGMSAKVEVNVEEAAELTVPIVAVSEKQGVAYVKKQDPTSKKFIDVPVKIGKTTADSVVVLSNLKVGDKIVVPA
ncbi:MAG: efflux RND transporter periplasmic adaptor subunit [Gammaproteobacteria bacterium]|nr:efflux RND transporter periplasmic adaptor subunit [Gammaproteobacteria bacterium]